VDTAVATAVSASDVDATLATTGHITIPTNAGDLIINWGQTGSVTKASSPVAVVFDEPFPNSFLAAVVARNIASNGGEAGANFAGASGTGMNIYPTFSGASVVHYIAIGY
jgi:hypothetical protein